MAFDQAAVLALMDAVTSHAMTLGIFETVNTHEPKSKPGNGLRCSVWADQIMPLGGASGLAATSGQVILNIRVFGNMIAKPEDDIDPNILTAVTTLIGAYSADFTLGGTVRNIDLLGEYGPKLSAQAGYVNVSGSLYRIMDITVPVIINDMWTQEA
jgi:hypothetical protein